MNKINRNIFKYNLFNKHVTWNWSSTSAVKREKFIEANQGQLGYQPVADFYAGKSVFLTGATGFIGRLLIERLLYTCKDIEKIYILIRAKKNASVQQRLQELIENPIFTKLKAIRPQDLNKIVPIAGDVGEVRLGINSKDEQTLVEKVSVVFHSAANVKFRAPLIDLMKVNYEGTREVMEMGKKIKKLDVFVHVSTIFNNSNDSAIEEIPYPPPKSVEYVYKILKNHSNDSKEVRDMQGKEGNSYVFSKKMGEAYAAYNHGNMRTIIVRPSMVTSIYKEPLVGYTDSWVAGTVLLCDIARGLTRVVYGNKDVIVELIPADYVCNFLIVAAAKTNKDKSCNVYNLTTSDANPISWRKIVDIYIKEGKNYGYMVMPFPGAYFTKSKWAMSVLILLTQELPAYIADLWLRLLGKPPRYGKLQKAATSRAILSSPVTYLSWNIKTTRRRLLLSGLDNKDREKYPCDPASIDWEKYVPIYCKGVKDYMLDNQKK